MNNQMIWKIAGLAIFILLQAVIFNHVVLFGIAFCFVYLAFLIGLPFEMGSILAMLIGLITGLSIDMFVDSIGIHASACVLIMFFRPYLLQFITPLGGYPNDSSPTSAAMGLAWYTTYALPLIFVHHFVLFFVEYGGFNLFFRTMTKVIATTLFTYLMVVLIGYLMSSQRAKR